ncbi:hypothetical protein NDU88_010529 [Pleurodeles waltl]|uniref:Uncharacterized protein n=1 Tax=Pleurodeles waltl TaxID=8319 RepID=A0AAV7S1I3_PLEWA|nr:hypothetical protein NDU88_010529 [Pleurodeles waltl]
MPRGYVPGRPRPHGHFRCLLARPRSFFLSAGERKSLTGAGSFKAPDEEEKAGNQTTRKEPAATLEEAEPTPHPRFGRNRQEAAGH